MRLSKISENIEPEICVICQSKAEEAGGILYKLVHYATMHLKLQALISILLL